MTVIGRNLGKLARRLPLSATAVICAVVATEPAFAPVAWAQTEKESSPVMPRTTPAETEEARAAITRGYQILDQAVAAKDTAAFAKVLAPDAKIVASGFEFGLIAYQAMLSNMLAPLVEVSQVTEIETLDVAGDRATVGVRGRFRMVAKEADGKPVVTVVLGTTTDSWLATPAGWRLTKTVETSQRILVDGIEPTANATTPYPPPSVRPLPAICASWPVPGERRCRQPPRRPRLPRRRGGRCPGRRPGQVRATAVPSNPR